MRRVRSLLTISTVGGVLLLGVFAQPALAAGKPVAEVSASGITATGATVEATINPEGLKTEYEST